MNFGNPIPEILLFFLEFNSNFQPYYSLLAKQILSIPIRAIINSVRRDQILI